MVDAPRRALQEFMLRQRDAGMLLCLCSKNREEDVWAVFEQNPGMLLSREHLSGWRINWQTKSENLRSLAAELNLGIDSVIFLDDNPVECAEVEANCSEVLILQLPDDLEQLPTFLRHVWAFDHFKLTAEDKRRSESYGENAQRERLRGETKSLEDFLAGLELNIEIAPMAPEHVARVSQLTQRTNQFNSTTVRRTENEITQLLLGSRGMECVIVNLSDRFGDYGLIGVVIYEYSREALVVDSMLMSCRALGRRVEHKLLAHVAEIARRSGLEWVDIRFVQTSKNKPMEQFLDEIQGAQRIAMEGSIIYRIAAGVPVERKQSRQAAGVQ
jgi:FkbH-like protein